MAVPRVIFIHGPVASGKFTIAQELSARTGIRVFHNHLTVDLLLAVFPFGDAAFVRLRESIWCDVMAEAVGAATSLIFPFAPERTVSATFPSMIAGRIAERGGIVNFVQVRCSPAEIERRLSSPSREKFQKLTSLSVYQALQDGGAFAYPAIASECMVDSSSLPPTKAAGMIALALDNPAVRGAT